MELTIQTCLDGQWSNAGQLEIPHPVRGAAGPFNFWYELPYLKRHLGGHRPLAVVSARIPLGLLPVTGQRWPTFLDDIRPMGGARRWWLQRLNLREEPASDFELLRRGTVAPIGNLRILESLPGERLEPRLFPREAVIEREHEFIGYAADAGAQVGGATGAGGDSPKVLLRRSDSDQVWIDVWQDDPTQLDRHYLVKFARSSHERDRLILRSEHVYYRALAALGIDTIATEGMSLEEGAGGPSLWLPRFDVVHRNGQLHRLGMESVYSLVGSDPGAYLKHQDALAALHQVVTEPAGRALTLEYLKRDLLNLAFGNSDNHGRNMAILKTEKGVTLAPIYDFAPMKMDLEGVSRTTRWEHFEAGWKIDWPALLASFGADEPFLRTGLQELAERLRTLPRLLSDLGLPGETLDFPGLGLHYLEKTLRDWTLL